MFFEQNSFIITLSFSLFLIIFLAIYFQKEYALCYRKSIKFENYENKSLSFKFKTNKNLLSFQIVYLVIGLILSLVFGLNNVTRIYLIVYLLIISITVFLIITNITINKTNKDLSHFDSLYSQVLQNTQNKKKLEENIIKYQKQEEDFVVYCENIISKINKEIKIVIPNNYCKETIKNISKTIFGLKKQLNNYNENQIKEFNNLLDKFLYDGVIDAYENQTLNFISDEEFNVLINDSRNKVNDLIYQIILDSIKGDAVNNIESLINLLEFVKELGLSCENLLEDSMYYVSKVEEKKSFVNYIYDNNLLKVDLMINVVNQNNFNWMYNNKTFNYFNESDLFEILNSILNSNSVDCAYNCLMYIDSNVYSIIKKINDNTTIVNDTKDIFDMFISLYSATSGYNNEANMYENMTFSLLEYFTVNNNSRKKKINEIVNYGEFLENAEFIEINYRQALEDISVTVTNFIKVLITYGKSSCKNMNLIDFDKVQTLFQEYRSNLNIKGIEILCLILKSLILIEEIDSSIINMICSTIKAESQNLNIGITNFSPSKHIENGRKIIEYLDKKQNDNFIKILYRIEKTRLSYDRIIKL